MVANRRSARRSANSPPLTSLSIILPAYQAARYLRRCLNSLLCKAPAGLTLIVVDDGSSDESGAIAEEMAAHEGRIRVIHQSHSGNAAARNMGLSAACGEYLGFVNAGDEVEPGWVRALLTAAAAQHPAIVKGETRLFRGGRELPCPCTCASIAQRTPLHWCGDVWSAIYRRDFVQEHGLHFSAEFSADDVDFQVRAVVAAILDQEQIALCPMAVYRRLCHRSTKASPIFDKQQVGCALQIYARLHEFFLEHAMQLPAAGIGLQYFAWIKMLFEIARCAEYPDDAAAANALAQRLLQENPLPDEYEHERLVALAAGLMPPPRSARDRPG